MIKGESKPDLPRAFDSESGGCIATGKFSSNGTIEESTGNKAVLLVRKDKLVN